MDIQNDIHDGHIVRSSDNRTAIYRKHRAQLWKTVWAVTVSLLLILTLTPDISRAEGGDTVLKSDMQIVRFREKEQMFTAEVRERRQKEATEIINLQEEVSEETKARDDILSVAKSLIGNVRYDFGGKASHRGTDITWDENDTGLDCSGFVQWVYWTAGYPKELYRNLLSTTSIRNSLESIAYEELKIGDLGLFGEDRIINHVGIYAGEGKWVHCNATAQTVSIDEVAFTVFKRVPVEKYIELLYSEDEFGIKETMQER